MAEEGNKTEEEAQTNVSVKRSIFRARYCSIVVLFVLYFGLRWLVPQPAASLVCVSCIVHTRLVEACSTRIALVFVFRCV